MASLAGFGLGIGGVILHDRMDDRVRQPEDVQKTLGLPVLGLVPRIPSSSKEGEEVAPVVLESFRSIRAQLTRSMKGERTSIVITSPEPRDGKSLVSANLAISFASARRTTLLIDGDMRRGNAHQLFDVPSAPGIADYLSGDAGLSEIIRATDVPGLVLVPRGNIRGFDPDRLEGPELQSLLEAVRQRFDVVICDSPPLGAGPDAFLFGEQCDQALLVMRTGATEREVTKARLEASMYFDFPLVGAVLNDVPDSAPYYRYYSPYRYYLEEGEMVS
jgi:capsular exopolysaccharide synthesis family protein